jgi:hypothetical protein
MFCVHSPDRNQADTWMRFFSLIQSLPPLLRLAILTMEPHKPDNMLLSQTPGPLAHLYAF